MMEVTWVLVAANIVVWAIFATVLVWGWRQGRRDRDQHYH